MRQRSQQHGMTTAEYAVGTVAVATGVGVLITLLADPTTPAKVFWPVLAPLVRLILRVFGLASG